MKTILYLIYSACNGGSEKYVYDLAKYSISKGDRCILGYGMSGKLVDRMKKIGCECVNIEMKSIFDVSSIKKIRHLVKTRKVDVIHAQFARENYLAVFASMFLKNIEIVFTNHIILPERRLKKYLNWFISGFDKKIVCVSNASKKHMINCGYRHDKIMVIHNGIDIVKYDGSEKLRFRNNYAINKEDFVIVNVSRFTVEKGLEYLIDSFANFINKYGIINSKLLLVGDGELKKDILAQINRLEISDRVILSGYLDNPRIAIAASDLYVSSSSNENFSFSILEALSVCLPVVATDVGGNPELVNGDIGNGFLVKYKSDKLTERMYDIYSDEKLSKRLSEKSYEFVESNFKISDMLEKSVEIYN